MIYDDLNSFLNWWFSNGRPLNIPLDDPIYTYKDELGKTETKTVNESVEKTINNTMSSGSATTLIESKTYENPQFLRMKDLMTKIK